MSAAERALWDKASEELRISSVIRSTKLAAVVIRGSVVYVGHTCEASHGGRDYVFRLRKVDQTGACTWEAIAPNEESNRSFIAF